VGSLLSVVSAITDITPFAIGDVAFMDKIAWRTEGGSLCRCEPVWVRPALPIRDILCPITGWPALFIIDLLTGQGAWHPSVVFDARPMAQSAAPGWEGGCPLHNADITDRQARLSPKTATGIRNTPGRAG
jgi:hypothetical protein